MSIKPLLISIFLIILPVSIIYAQEEALPIEAAKTAETSEQIHNKPDFWLSFGVETALYSTSGLAYGGNLSLGYGSGSLIGFKAALFFAEEGDNIMELDLLLRFYLFGKNVYRGPFIQFIGGTSFFNRSGSFGIPSNLGMINAGLGFGWRFIFSERFFVEPAVRAGYPYFLGAGISAGMRF
jgi:hypothetical protein